MICLKQEEPEHAKGKLSDFGKHFLDEVSVLAHDSSQTYIPAISEEAIDIEDMASVN